MPTDSTDRIKHLHILLAEDNQGDIMLVAEALEYHRIPHQLYVVHDGDEALAYLSQIDEPEGVPCPDLVLLDLNLSKVDGAEVLTALRTHPHCRNTPVIVVTSSDTRKDRERMASLGVARYFRKPSDLEEFMHLGSVVGEVLGER